MDNDVQAVDRFCCGPWDLRILHGLVQAQSLADWQERYLAATWPSWCSLLFNAEMEIPAAGLVQRLMLDYELPLNTHELAQLLRIALETETVVMESWVIIVDLRHGRVFTPETETRIKSELVTLGFDTLSRGEPGQSWWAIALLEAIVVRWGASKNDTAFNRAQTQYDLLVTACRAALIASRRELLPTWLDGLMRIWTFAIWPTPSCSLVLRLLLQVPQQP